jgi:hypothetical protein
MHTNMPSVKPVTVAKAEKPSRAFHDTISVLHEMDRSFPRVRVDIYRSYHKHQNECYKIAGEYMTYRREKKQRNEGHKTFMAWRTMHKKDKPYITQHLAEQTMLVLALYLAGYNWKA